MVDPIFDRLGSIKKEIYGSSSSDVLTIETSEN
jgi:hypothetical protein